jgi:hypothetical protein
LLPLLLLLGSEDSQHQWLLWLALVGSLLLWLLYFLLVHGSQPWKTIIDYIFCTSPCRQCCSVATTGLHRLLGLSIHCLLTLLCMLLLLKLVLMRHLLLLLLLDVLLLPPSLLQLLVVALNARHRQA